MEHQWRSMLPPPPPSQSSICPICSISHFPFCPPPPPPPPPPPLSPFPPYNQNPRFPPYTDFPPPEPYNSANPSYGGYNNFDFRDGFGWQQQQQHQQQGYDYYNNNDDNGGVMDRRYKRARVSVDCEINDHLNSTTTTISLDNERRLKLIRDHGGASSNYMRPDQDSNVVSRNNINDNAVDINSHQFEYLADRDRNQNQDGFNDHHAPSYTKPETFNNINYHHQGGYFPQRPHEIRVSGGHHHQQSPPPPIPVEPPPPPPPPPPSLFPVPITCSSTNVYLHNKPSTTFLKEVFCFSSFV